MSKMLTESVVGELWASVPGHEDSQSIFKQMLSLRDSGFSLPAIAKNLDVSLATIDKWMHGRSQLAKQLWRRRV